MSKKSRRRNKVLAALALGLGASKLGMLGGKTQITGATGTDKRLFTDSAKKFKTAVGPTKKVKYPRLKVDSTGNVFKDGVNTGVGNTKTKFVNLDSSKGTGTGIYQGGKKVSDLNPKAINVLKDGKITTGGKTYANKKEYSSAMKTKRSLKRNTVNKKSNNKNPGLFGFTFDKPLFNKGTMVKARGGGMARNKPTKLY
tara:strand:- start:166 stop:759 length:594 start_codon:yes stop_codon:yes gene_type:complete